MSLEEENTYLKARQYNFGNVSENETIFQKFTGIALDKFHLLYDLVSPGSHSENMMMYDRTRLEAELLTPKKVGIPKSGPKPSLDGIEQLFMVLVWLKNGFTETHLAWLFDTTQSTVSRYLITWVNLLYFFLGRIPIWPTREVIDLTMPETFKNTYPTKMYYRLY